MKCTLGAHQTRALFTEVEQMLDEFGQMWSRSRVYRSKLEEMGKERQGPKPQK